MQSFFLACFLSSGYNDGMSSIKERIKFYTGRIKEGRLKEMWRQTKWIYGYAKRYWVAMIFYTLLGMSGVLTGLFSSWVSKDVVDIITGHKTGEIVKYFAMMIAVAIGNILISQFTSYVSNWISIRVGQELSSEMYEKIMETDWESLTNYHTGDLLTRWGADTGTIANGILNFIPNLIINVFRFFSAFYMVIRYDWTFAIFALIGIPFSLLMSKTLLARMRNNNERSMAMSAKMSGFNQESFANIQTLKAFDLVKLYVQRLRQLQKEYKDMKMEFQRMSIATSIILGLVGLLVSYSSYGWGIYRVWSGVISYGTMTMFLSLSGQLTGSVNTLAGLIPSAISLTISAGRLMDIVEMPREDYSKYPEASEFLEKHRAEGFCLCADKIAYTYKTGTEVFSAASFEAKPHEIIGLVGPSGEGKTTMLRLLLALMPVKEGEIRIEAQDGESMGMAPYMRQFFSYVPQGNTMMSGTVRSNMENVKPDVTDEEIEEALKMACAWDFIERLPDGINAEVKERGGGFSEGQGQRLAIARALIRKAPILLLDEASSALDVATERKVLKNIMQDTYPRVCIVTTHRPTVLNLCKRVYAIRDKECVELPQEEVDRMIKDF